MPGQGGKMLNKGLCLTCDNEKSCIYAKDFPVLECEEFAQSMEDEEVCKDKVPAAKV